MMPLAAASGGFVGGLFAGLWSTVVAFWYLWVIIILVGAVRVYMLNPALFQRLAGIKPKGPRQHELAVEQRDVQPVRYGAAAKPYISQAELQFYRALVQAVPGLLVCPQAAVSLVVEPVGENRQAAMNKIDRKRLDFVLADPKTGMVVLAIELDDASHNTEKARQRDDFVNKALNSAGVPLLRVPWNRTYDATALSAAISQLLQPR